MKVLSAIILGCSLISFSFLSAEGQQKPKGCHCKNCRCTPESHCGCFSQEGCKCGEHTTNCGLKDQSLGLNEPSLHHGNAEEHEDDESDNT